MKAETTSNARSVPRRRRPSLVARLRPFWILLVVLAGLLVWAGIWLEHAPWFRIARVTIDVPVGSPVSSQAVAAAAAVPSDANLWLIDPGGMKRRIEAIPYVDQVTIRRTQFPRPILDIWVTMRRPSACVSASRREVTIDDAARVLQSGCVRTALPLIDAGNAAVPLPGDGIADAEITGLLADAKILAEGGVAVRQMRRDRWGGLVAVDATGVTLEFGGDADLARKAALVGPVRNGIGTKRPIRAIDLRAPGTPTVDSADSLSPVVDTICGRLWMIL